MYTHATSLHTCDFVCVPAIWIFTNIIMTEKKLTDEVARQFLSYKREISYLRASLAVASPSCTNFANYLPSQLMRFQCGIKGLHRCWFPKRRVCDFRSHEELSGHEKHEKLCPSEDQFEMRVFESGANSSEVKNNDAFTKSVLEIKGLPLPLFLT